MLEKEILLDFINSLDDISIIAIPIICVIGIILNLICFIVFICLKEKIFFYLAINVITESLFLLIGALASILLCRKCDTENTYLKAIYNLIINRFFASVLYSMITILEIQISFNRYFLVTSHNTKTIIELKDKAKIFIYFIICVLIHLPYCFAFKIQKNEMSFVEDTYSLEYNHFGNTDFMFYYSNYILIFENILAIFVLLPLNIIIIVKFKKFIKKKNASSVSINVLMNNLNNNNNNNNKILQNNCKTETRFTRLIVITSFLYIMSRLYESIISIILIYNHYIQIDYLILYLNIIMMISNLITYLILSSSYLIFYFLNKTFRLKFKQIFCFFIKN